MPTKTRTTARAKGSKRSIRKTPRQEVVSERLRELRRDRDYSLIQFADAIGAKENTAREWFRYTVKVFPRAEALISIAEHFDVTIDWILGITGAQKRRSQSREPRTLEDDLRVEILSRVKTKLREQQIDLTHPEWLEQKIDRTVTGDRLLLALAGIVEREYERAARWVKSSNALLEAIIALEVEMRSGRRELAGAVLELKELYEVAVPQGAVIQWEDVDYAKAARERERTIQRIRVSAEL